MVFENGVKNIQAAAYNGARTELYQVEEIYHFCPDCPNDPKLQICSTSNIIKVKDRATSEPNIIQFFVKAFFPFYMHLLHSFTEMFV